MLYVCTKLVKYQKQTNKGNDRNHENIKAS